MKFFLLTLLLLSIYARSEIPQNCKVMTICTPTRQPTKQPTKQPTRKPSRKPTHKPSTLFPSPSPTTYSPTMYCTAPYNLILVLDQTGSETVSKYKKALPIIIELLSNIDIRPQGVNVALIEIEQSVVKVAFNLSTSYSVNKGRVLNYIESGTYKGGWTNFPQIPTKIVNVLKNMYSYRKQYKTVVLIFSDGYPELPNTKTAQLRKQTRNAFHKLKKDFSGIYFQAIGYGTDYFSNPANQALLNYISTPRSVLTLSTMFSSSFIEELEYPTCDKPDIFWPDGLSASSTEYD